MTERLLAADPANRVLGFDLQPPRRPHERLEFHRLDVRDPALGAALRGREVAALLHFAFIVDPLYDEAEMSDIDLGGTWNALAAARAAGVPYLLATSSTTAYGALADNPVPLTEDAPLRASAAFRYAHDKRLMDTMLADFAAAHPEVRVGTVRPCIVLGPNVANYIALLLLSLPVATLLDGANPPLQFVHEDDLVDLLQRCVARQAAGAYNAVGAGTIDLRGAAALQDKRALWLPHAAIWGVAWAAFRLRLLPFALPPGVLDFFRYPWVASGAKAERELGFRPRHATRDCFALIVSRRAAILAAFRERLRARREGRVAR